MRILPVRINFFNKPNYQKSKIIMPLKQDMFTFSGKIRSQKEIQDEKNRIKELLQETVKQGRRISGSELSKKLDDIPVSTIKTRINSDDELYYLWQKARAVDNSRYSEIELQEFKQALLEMLTSAKENLQKISMKEMSDKLGVSENVTLRIFKNNPELEKMFEEVKLRSGRPYKTKDEKKAEIEAIKSVLELAISEGRKVTFSEISEYTKIKTGSIHSIINSDCELAELYEKVKNKRRFTQGTLDEKQELVKDRLRFYMQKGMNVKMSDLVDEIGISHNTFCKWIKEDDEINNLWAQVRYFERPKYNAADLKELDDYIDWYIYQKKQKQQKVTMQEIADYFQVPKSVISKRIYDNPSLNYNWQRVKTQKSSYTPQDIKQDQTEQIVEILKGFDKINQKATLSEVSAMVNLSVKAVRNRINSNASALKLWNRVRRFNSSMYSSSALTKQQKEIEHLLLEAINSKTKVTFSDIARKLNIPTSLLYYRIKSSERLYQLCSELGEKNIKKDN